MPRPSTKLYGAISAASSSSSSSIIPSYQRTACFCFALASYPLSTYLGGWAVGRLVKKKKRFLSSLQCIQEMSGRLGQCYDTSYGGSQSPTFGHIQGDEFSDDMSRSRRLSLNQTLLLVLSQLRPCVLCVYRSEQPISFILPRLALVRL